tara:strand:- start:757 stop:954 length:198 start_codon:yes stop_codon:yes gene_type:complete
MKQYKDRSTSTRLLSNPEGTSYKLIIKYGDNITEKIFDGKNAYNRATTFQNGISEIMRLAKNIKR